MAKKQVSKDEIYADQPAFGLIVRKTDSPAVGILGEVDRLLGEVVAGEAMLDVNWMKLGTLLEEVQVKEHWRGTFKSFGAYLMELQVRYKRGRSQLYNYISTVHELRGKLTDEQLAQIGIAKARALTDGIKSTGRLLPAAVEVALQPESTVEDIRKTIFTGENQDEKGNWYTLTGFMVSKDEKETLDLAFETAHRTDPMPPKDWKPWQILKDSLLKMAMEFISSHPEVETFGEETEF